MIWIIAIAALFLYTGYQVVRQDDRLDKARGPVRFLLILFMGVQLFAGIYLAQQLP